MIVSALHPPGTLWTVGHSTRSIEAFLMDTTEFGAAAGRLAEVARDDRVATMCAEGVWWRCHRSMIADFFKAHGWAVLHVLGQTAPSEHPYTSVARIVAGELVY